MWTSFSLWISSEMHMWEHVGIIFFCELFIMESSPSVLLYGFISASDWFKTVPGSCELCQV